MKRRSLVFSAPERVEVREEEMAGPGPGEVLVETRLSAISPGTEMMIYRGEAPQDMTLDESIPALQGTFSYPFKYGYAAVGQVVELGSGVERGWMGRRVFSFHPHESPFAARTEELLPAPDDVDDETAVLLPNMETAVNFVMDGRPMIGETAAVFGLGMVGLLTTALLARFPLAAVVGFDPYECRREEARMAGATAALDPAGEGVMNDALRLLGPRRADLVYELSGNPAALDAAVEMAGFEGRVVVGSWYGNKQVSVNLGGRFHRSRIRLISSQVSTLAGELAARWDKGRRMDVAWESLRSIQPARWITHRVPFGEAEEAYRLLAEGGERVLGVVFDYRA